MRIVELARHLRGSGDRMDIDETWFAGNSTVSVGHRQHDAFVQPLDDDEFRPVDESIEKTDFVGSRIGKDESSPGRLNLLGHQIAARAGNDPGRRLRTGWLLRNFTALRRLEHRFRGNARQTHLHERSEKTPS